MSENEELVRLLGHLPDGTPIWQQVGFAPEDEDEWTPPSREEYEALQRKLARANKEAAKRRKALKARQADDEDDLDGAEDDEDGSGKRSDRKELKRLLARAEARVEARYKPALVKQAAKSALVDAGFSGEITNRTMGLLNLDSLEVDEDGEVVGLDEAIEELKEDLPQLFKRSHRGTAKSSGSTGRKSLDGGVKKTAKKPQSHAEILAAQLLGK